MLTKRIIPCLDIDAGRVVKGVNFVNIIDARINNVNKINPFHNSTCINVEARNNSFCQHFVSKFPLSVSITFLRHILPS